MRSDSRRTFYEFFAGAGMARLGLGPNWTCLMANDFDSAKAAAYENHFGAGDMRCADINSLNANDLPGRAKLAWASFPCQDLSLAGGRGGLNAPRSGAFFAFWRLIRQLAAESREPEIIALENVSGLLTSRKGADFAALIETMTKSGYRTGAVLLDAADFLPQSRPRLFIIGFLGDPPASLSDASPDPHLTPPALRRAFEALPQRSQENFVWWRVPRPPLRNAALAELVDWSAPEACWRSDAQTQQLLAQMSPPQRLRVEALRKSKGKHVGALYRRIRSENGVKVQRAEARFDGLAGCLRTPGGGSSRQFLLFIENGAIRSRLLSPREAARLMGMPEDYRLPASTHKALHLAGDGVAAPVVRHLAETLLEPLLDTTAAAARRSARKARAA